MFVIEVENFLNQKSRHYWMNAADDDFARYLPKNFGVAKEKLRFWVFEDDDMPVLEGAMKALGQDGALDLSVDGKIKVCRTVRTESPGATPEAPPIVSESLELVAEFTGVEARWPYSAEWKMTKPELGTFLGFKPL